MVTTEYIGRHRLDGQPRVTVKGTGSDGFIEMPPLLSERIAASFTQTLRALVQAPPIAAPLRLFRRSNRAAR